MHFEFRSFIICLRLLSQSNYACQLHYSIMYLCSCFLAHMVLSEAVSCVLLCVPYIDALLQLSLDRRVIMLTPCSIVSSSHFLPTGSLCLNDATSCTLLAFAL